MVIQQSETGRFAEKRFSLLRNRVYIQKHHLPVSKTKLYVTLCQKEKGSANQKLHMCRLTNQMVRLH